MAFAAIAAGLSLAGTAFAGFTQWQSAQYQAAVASNNAKTAKQNAARASDAAQEQQRRSDIEYAATVGGINAAQSASGLDTLGISQLAVRNRTRNAGRMAALDIRQGGEDEIRQFLADEQSYRAQKKQFKTQALNTAISTGLKLGAQAADSFGVGTKTSLASSASSIRRGSSRYMSLGG